MFDIGKTLRRSIASLMSIVFLTQSAIATECPISLPEPFSMPESGHETPKHFSWVGSTKLAARVPGNGHWTAMGAEYNYRDKWWWWREGYKARNENNPELTISARKLNSSAPPVEVKHATNAFGNDWDRILIMMEFPSAGCWEVIGTYHDQQLRFVFLVGDASD